MSNNRNKRAIVAEIATIIQERGGQSEDDLIRLGYTHEQVKSYAPLAVQKLALEQRAA